MAGLVVALSIGRGSVDGAVAIVCYGGGQPDLRFGPGQARRMCRFS